MGVTFPTNYSTYVSKEIYQPGGAIINNPNRVKLQDKTAFIDYGNLNEAINEYNKNASSVTPTWLDYERYMSSRVLSLEFDGVSFLDSAVNGRIKISNYKEDYDNVILVIAAYSGDRLAGKQLTPVSVVCNEIKDIDFSFENENISGVKAFIWDSEENMKPLCGYIETEAKQE